MRADTIWHKLTLKKGTKVIPCLLLLFVVACSPTRHLQEDEKLLTKVKIKVDGEQKFSDELKSIPKQKENRKLLGLFKIYLGIYNLYYKKEDSKIKDNIGEPPVIYDSTLNIVSADLMTKYLNNRGYYKSEVSVEVKESRKKVKLKYHVKENARFTIQELSFNIKDENIAKIFNADIGRSELKIDSPFDLDALKKERVRIENLLKNNGYYEFSREYVVFKVDTFYRTNAAHLNVSIRNPMTYDVKGDSSIAGSHKLFNISKVIVRMGYDNQQSQDIEPDTQRVDSYLFIDYLHGKFKKDVISRLISIQPGDLYSINKQQSTYRAISSLRVFSYLGIRYERDYSKGGNQLIAYIDLNPRKQKAITLETEGTNNGGNLGMNGTITFQNNNTFRGAEALNISLSGGIEAQQIFTDDSDEEQIIDGILPFNTLEFGPELRLDIPRFLFPVFGDRVSLKGDPRTSFNASFNFQERPDYNRSVTKTFVAYSWSEGLNKTHIVHPFDLSYINLNPTQEFVEFLEQQNSFVRNSYTDNLILALRYSFIFNNKSTNQLKNHTFFRFNFESAGNTLAFLTNGINEDIDENGSYRILGVQYAQYLRADIDYRYYQMFNYNQMVYRFSTGYGMPYGNSIAMPFEKSFYAGGANGIRAWRARELGPGTLPDTAKQSIDQIGNMFLEANVEFRFKITEIFESTAFVDAGNIWNLDQDNSLESTQFRFNRLWDGLAIGVGTGLRLNFSFFILRFDVATPIKDPATDNPKMLKAQWDQTNLNLGIGYPF